jgi:hypothetical protein
LVLKNMWDLMKAMGQADKFDSPDAWMDAIIERPRPRAHSSTEQRRSRRTVA